MIEWEHHKMRGATGCSEWWQYDAPDGGIVEVMYFTEKMHFDRPDIPLGWVYLNTNESYEWEPFPDTCTSQEECLAYMGALLRMGEYHEMG